jgi:hypothetical protein
VLDAEVLPNRPTQTLLMVIDEDDIHRMVDGDPVSFEVQNAPDLGRFAFQVNLDIQDGDKESFKKRLATVELSSYLLLCGSRMEFRLWQPTEETGGSKA